MRFQLPLAIASILVICFCSAAASAPAAFHMAELAVGSLICTQELSRTSERRDTLVPADIPYQGFRLHLREVQLLKQKKDKFLLGVELVNTGKRAITFGPGFPARMLQTDFDVAMAQGGLLPLALPLRAAILQEQLSLEPGQSLKGMKFWVEESVFLAQPTARMDTFAKQRMVLRRASSTSQALPVLDSSAGSLACIDLMIVGMKLSQRGKSTAILQLDIKNSGNSIMLASQVNSGTSLDIFLGGSPKVTNASRRIVRIELASRLMSALEEGPAPESSITLIEKIDISTATRYTGVIVAQLDPGQLIAECDETNNESSVNLYD